MNPRTLAAGSPRVAWRRAVADRGLLLAVLLLVTVTAFLGLAGPRLVTAAADDAARGAVRDAGGRADVVAELGTRISTAASSPRDGSMATEIQNGAAEIGARLPQEVQRVTGDPSAALLSGRLTLRSAQDGAVARFVWLWRGGSVPVAWVEGAAPQTSQVPVDVSAPGATTDATATDPAPAHLVEVGLTRAGADVVGARVGDHLTISGATRGHVEVVVSGIYSPVDSADPLWTTVPGLLEPVALGTSGATTPTIGLLLSDASLPDVALALAPGAMTTRYRFPADGSALLSDDVDRVRSAISALVANPSVLTMAGGATPTVTSGLDSLLGEHQARLRGAQAQASVLLVGLVAVGVLALLLASRLVVGRRHALIAAERARGASIASVALRLALESVPLAVVGVGLGTLGSWVLDRVTPWTWWPGIAVALVTVLAVPSAGAHVASTSWTGRRSPANRKDRDRLRGRRRARRTVLELTVVVLALAATSSARGRGFQQTQTQGVDLLLAATPVLLAGAVTVVVLRAFPTLLRLLAHAAARRRGLVPLVATARATRTGSLGLPLLALTVALGLLVFSGITAASAQRGEERAALEVVGADVRLDGVVAPDVLAALRTADGVTAIAEGTRFTGRTVNSDPALKATVLAIDAAAYATIASAHDLHSQNGLTLLDSTGGPSTRPRAVVSGALVAEVAERGARVFVGGATVELDVVGTTDLGRPGEALVIVDRTALAPFVVDPIEPDRTWVDGSGAAAAVLALHADHALTGIVVTDRAAWLTQLRNSPLVRSVVALLAAAALVLALYAALTLVLTVTATSPERGRTLSSLRTLGLDRGATWRITLGELAPLTTVGVLAGAAIGVGVPVLLAGALGLNQLTGEADDTAVAITAGPFLLAVGASLVALILSVVVESAVRRRENPGAILRVGER